MRISVRSVEYQQARNEARRRTGREVLTSCIFFVPGTDLRDFVFDTSGISAKDAS